MYKCNEMRFCGIDIATTHEGILLDTNGNILSKTSIVNPRGKKEIFWYNYIEKVMDYFLSKGRFTSNEEIICLMDGMKSKNITFNIEKIYD